jgi:hypothetical protein
MPELVCLSRNLVCFDGIDRDKGLSEKELNFFKFSDFCFQLHADLIEI